MIGIKQTLSAFAIALQLGLLLSANAQPSVKPANANPRFWIYLLAGQSNMSGRADLSDTVHQRMTGYPEIRNSRIKMLDANNNWVPARHPIHFDYPNAGIGPGMAFAVRLLESIGDTTIVIGLVPAAVGGSNSAQWLPSSTGSLYATAVKRTFRATSDGVLKGILFHQGEADIQQHTTTGWSDRINTIISELRGTFNRPGLPFIIGEIGYFVPGHEQINSQIAGIASSRVNVSRVSADGLEDKGDHLHFNGISSSLLGKRYADAMKRIQNNNVN